MASSHAALFEFRLDYFDSRDLKLIADLLNIAGKPVIFTLRPKWMGGQYEKSEAERLNEMIGLCDLHPAYIDIENKEFFETLRVLYPQLKIIFSCHDFEGTPCDLPKVYESLRSVPADYYKLATFAASSSDAFRLMLYLKNQEKTIGVSMGPHGLPSRVLAQKFNSLWSYASTEYALAPGQMSCQEINALYGNSTQDAKLYGLIGSPVHKSISHYTHNTVMREYNLNALYLKMEVSKEELSSFLKLLKDFGWHGLSVTMPLKEAVLPLIEADEESRRIGAVNTLLFKNGRLLGYNTDGIGAMRALEQKCDLKNKKMALLGRGGAAKAIACYAGLKDCEPKLFCRELKHFNCRDYDIIINCTPVELPFDCQNLRSDTIVMDINTTPCKSALLKIAESKGCPIVYGYEMFLYQAVYQFALWFPDLSISQIEISLRRECRKVLNLLE